MPPLRALASVDVNGGARLPCERLVAPAPPDGGGLAYLSNVAVAPAFRGRGVGAALLAHALATAAAGGASRVAVHAELRNAAAVALYGRLFGAARVVEPLAVEAAAGRARRALFWLDV
jgi:ribosomal protein S18 acetylase RimI-like enzyme